MTFRCVHSADQNMAAYNHTLDSIMTFMNVMTFGNVIAFMNVVTFHNIEPLIFKIAKLDLNYLFRKIK